MVVILGTSTPSLLTGLRNIAWTLSILSITVGILVGDVYWNTDDWNNKGASSLWCRGLPLNSSRVNAVVYTCRQAGYDVNVYQSSIVLTSFRSSSSYRLSCGQSAFVQELGTTNRHYLKSSHIIEASYPRLYGWSRGQLEVSYCIVKSPHRSYILKVG